MTLLQGKRLVITGVLTEQSIAFAVARVAQEQGAEVVLTSFGRALSLTRRAAGRLPTPADVLELDLTEPSHLAALTEDLSARWGRLDGALHAVAFAPEACLGGDILRAGWEDVAHTLHVSTYSLKALAEAVLPLMRDAGGSIVTLDFDARQAWPAYDWMGVAKAALEATARYLARDLGRHQVRVNLVSAGPLRTLAAKGIPGFSLVEDTWAGRAPLGWDTRDATPVAQACVALFSDWFPATTGEMIHVDGGFHAQAAPAGPPPSV
ncbi:MAG: enoyl-ACP reductase FabI [Acidimicrobiales bacterium]